jgi:hypothetical protein
MVMGCETMKMARTYDFEENWKINFGLGVDLALVQAPISLVNGLNSQIPIVRVGNVNDGEARIGSIDGRV